MSACRWSKRCFGREASRAIVNRGNTAAARLYAIEGMIKFGTVCRRHVRELLDMPAEAAQTELKGT